MSLIWTVLALAIPLSAQPPAPTPQENLLQSIREWKSFIPADPEAPLHKKFMPELSVIKQRITTGPHKIETLQADFEVWKRKLLAELYVENETAFFSDPQRFEQYVNDRLAITRALQTPKVNAAAGNAQVKELRSSLGAFSSWSGLSWAYDRFREKSKTTSSPFVVVDGSGGGPRAPEKVVFTNLDVAKAWQGRLRPERTAPPPSPDLSNEPLDEAKLRAALRKDGASQAVIDAGFKYAKDYNVDPRLVFGLMRQESGFNPKAESHAGAQGLMQLMPQTAAGLGVDNPWNIWENVKGGVKFLAGRLKKWTSDANAQLEQFADWAQANYSEQIAALHSARTNAQQAAALASLKPMVDAAPEGVRYAIGAYNAGDRGVTRWYKETRNYVVFVLSNFVRYHKKATA